jgi:hypothetical protein
MSVKTSAGTIVNVLATLPSSYDSTGFAALAWGTGNQIGEVTNIGNFGTKYNVQSHLPIASTRAQKIKGSYDTGDLPLTIGRDITDAGQVILRAALASANNYSFRLSYPDGSKVYVAGKVTSLETVTGGTDTITALEVTVALDSNIIEV